MDNKIKKLVELVFEDVPYSLEISKAQKNIKIALNAEYASLCTKMKKHEAMEEIMSNYGKLSDMAELAGYSREDAENYFKV